MVIKKSIQCLNCKKNVDFYIEEGINIKGVTVKCDCGTSQKCIDYNKYISRWRKINEKNVDER